MTTNSLPASGKVTHLTILGMLSFRPMHGYQIRSEIELRKMERWADIKAGSIYQALRKLNSQDMIAEEEISRQGNRPSRTVYRITDKGRDRLAELLRAAWRFPRMSADSVEVALSFVTLLEAKEVTELLNDRLDNIADIEKELAQEREHIIDAPEGTRQMVIDLFQHRLDLLEAEKGWAQKVLKRVKAGDYL